MNEQQWRRFSFIDQLACAAVTTGNVRNASLKPVLPVLDRLWGRLSTFQSINPDCEIPMTPTRGQSSGGNYWVRLLRRREGEGLKRDSRMVRLYAISVLYKPDLSKAIEKKAAYELSSFGFFNRSRLDLQECRWCAPIGIMFLCP